MVKIFTSSKMSAEDQDKKRRKKQAKQEAKLLLQLEDARKQVRRAEQKVARAQEKLEACRNEVYKLEEQLAGQKETAVATVPAVDPGESYEDSQAITELHRASMLPVEGRSDIEEESISIPASEPQPVTETPQEAEITTGTTPEEAAEATGTASTELNAPEVKESQPEEPPAAPEQARGADALEISAEESNQEASATEATSEQQPEEKKESQAEPTRNTRRSNSRRTTTRSRRAASSSTAENDQEK